MLLSAVQDRGGRAPDGSPWGFQGPQRGAGQVEARTCPPSLGDSQQ